MNQPPIMLGKKTLLHLTFSLDKNLLWVCEDNTYIGIMKSSLNEIMSLQKWSEASQWAQLNSSRPSAGSLAFSLASVSSPSVRLSTGLWSNLAGTSFDPAESNNLILMMYKKI